MDKNIREYISSPEALCSARLDEICEGAGRGSRIIQVSNGSGLEFTVCPDRALDIVECRFKGINVAFTTPSGYVAPGRCEHQGFLWLRGWQGGLMTTSGLRNSGVPSGDQGLHGRASAQQTENLSISRTEDGLGIIISGEWREAAMFGENLRLRRTITTAWQDNSITLRDEIVNMAAKDDHLQLLYHCNFGYPFVSPALQFHFPEHDVVPRDPVAAAGLDSWDKMGPPTPDFAEQCFFHKLPADSEKIARLAVSNPEVGIRMEMEYSADTLPHFVQWKNCLSRLYVLGLEPGNVSLQGREADIASGQAPKLAPDETVRTMLRFKFS